ncbi:MAG: lipopolysaccharide kinase InaA family protein [Tateyamaria sp.]
MRHVIRGLFAGWRFEAARLMREFELTSWMRTHGPLVAKVVAARTVPKMHHTGICHSDLNRRSIPLEGVGAVWLKDFDKCARRPLGAWMQRNLERLHRSLCEDDGQGALHWSPADRTAFSDGYQKGARK